MCTGQRGVGAVETIQQTRASDQRLKIYMMEEVAVGV
jgi:hypothetical protein